MSEEYDSDSSSDSSTGDQSTDDECLLNTMPSTDTSKERAQDTGFDPQLTVSDHESDFDDDGNPRLSCDGYKSCDTDEEEDNLIEPDAESRLGKLNTDWCTCGNCKIMNTDLGSYCCRESDLVNNTIIEAESMCVTEAVIFKTVIGNKDVLELSAYGASSKWTLKKNADGSLKMESLRYQAYRSFLNICALRGLGKSRRCAMPACVVLKIRELYPADSGLYKEFQEGDYNSQI